MALSEQEFRAAKSEAARKAGATKVAGREIKKIIDGAKVVCNRRLRNLETLGMELTQHTQDGDETLAGMRNRRFAHSLGIEAVWCERSGDPVWVLGAVLHGATLDTPAIHDEQIDVYVRRFEAQLIRKAQAVAPDVQIKRRYGGLVFEAKVTLEGMTQAADSLLGEGWRDELPVRRRRRRRRNGGAQ